MKFSIAVTTIYEPIASMIKKNSFLNVFSDNPLRIRWPIAIPKIAGTTETEDHIPSSRFRNSLPWRENISARVDTVKRIPIDWSACPASILLTADKKPQEQQMNQSCRSIYRLQNQQENRPTIHAEYLN